MPPLTMHWTVLLSMMFAASALWASRDQPVDPPENGLAQKPTQGEPLFMAHCAICHGMEGVGGRGPRLDTPKLRRAANKQAIVDLSRRGIRGTEMPGNWWMTDGQRSQLADYVLSLGRVAEVSLPGDPARGKAIYEANDCGDCHIIRSQGTSFGPELTGVGLRRNADYLRQALTEPDAAVPKNFLMVVAGTSAGTVEGIRVNEDSFSIQLFDADGRFHSFRKLELKSLQKQFGETPMPSYEGSLDDDELDNLVAYLATLRGDR